jgi:beta-glucuronidase
LAYLSDHLINFPYVSGELTKMQTLFRRAMCLFFFSFCCLTATAANLTQNSAAREHLSLDGAWHFVMDPYENGFYNHRMQETPTGYFLNRKKQNPTDHIEYNFAQSPVLQVPGDWNTQRPELLWYEGTIWYQRDFTVKKQADQNYILHFGAVNYQAIVYVNGQKVGKHEGGFTAFEFDVTNLLKDGDNFVVVKADNRRERDQVPTVNTDWWNYGGITRSVRLLTLPKQYVTDYSLALAKNSAQQVTGWVEVNNADEGGKVTVAIPELGIKHSVELKGEKRQSFSFNVKPSLWSPDNPKLYDVSITYNSTVVKDRIGFRTIAVKGEDILLNGKSIFLKGISIHEESALHDGRAYSESDARQLLRMAKELGTNFVRLAHYPHNEYMLRVADEMGLLVWSEIPVYWTVQFESPAVYANAQNQLEEMISRDKNRASIILWSMANETPISDARLIFLTRLAEKARELDGTRLITAALDTSIETVAGKEISDPLAKVVDIIGINNYCGWYYKTPAECATQRWISNNNKPVIMSEMGGGAKAGWRPETGDRWSEGYLVDVYKNNFIMMENMKFLRGMTPWILKDFRSPRRPLPGIKDYFNRKGLVSDKGVKKDAWYILNEYYKTR